MAQYFTKQPHGFPGTDHQRVRPHSYRHDSCWQQYQICICPGSFEMSESDFGSGLVAGFEEMARAANESAIGRRNGGCCVSLQGSERALLAFLLAKLQELDADVYAGHNISGFDLDVLLHRLQHHKVQSQIRRAISPWCMLWQKAWVRTQL